MGSLNKYNDNKKNKKSEKIEKSAKNHGHTKTRPCKLSGAEGGTRTPTMFPTSDFESDASANSATSAKYS